jgi:hypothetical protein
VRRPHGRRVRRCRAPGGRGEPRPESRRPVARAR